MAARLRFRKHRRGLALFPTHAVAEGGPGRRNRRFGSHKSTAGQPANRGISHNAGLPTIRLIWTLPNSIRSENCAGGTAIRTAVGMASPVKGSRR